MSQFVSTSKHCPRHSLLEWDIAETLLETLTLELSSSEDCFRSITNLSIHTKCKPLQEDWSHRKMLTL